jgi:hypothetical protein
MNRKKESPRCRKCRRAMLNSRNKDKFGFIHVKCELKELLEKNKDKEITCPFYKL